MAVPSLDSVSFIGNLTTETLAASLRGLEVERWAHEHNVANIETPGYQARLVEFRDALKHAIDQGRPLSMEADVSISRAATRVNGNNVDVTHELTGLAENGLEQQLIVSALNAQYQLIRTAIER